MISALVGAACPLIFAVAVLAICALLHRDRRRTAMATTPCRSCRTPKPSRIYLCAGCWAALTAETRRSLNRRDSKALARLRELHQQIDAGVPLAEIGVTP
ncbi:hypothetical protein [Streptomyces phaeochromogenes]|uniref:hypothetical protein n=1 Tax=Streptomyces phaeochromogenes TaxID=1923 RepID=UPI002DD7D86B|nr:hypothetical protein [Streptomyces phaeochromogenes]WRZ30216.1 hypothetical protein OG931_21925 [Streptomyces phaeochromogenes]